MGFNTQNQSHGINIPACFMRHFLLYHIFYKLSTFFRQIFKVFHRIKMKVIAGEKIEDKSSHFFSR